MEVQYLTFDGQTAILLKPIRNTIPLQKIRIYMKLWISVLKRGCTGYQVRCVIRSDEKPYE